MLTFWCRLRLGKPGGDQRIVQARCASTPECARRSGSAAAALGREQFVARRVENHPRDQLARCAPAPASRCNTGKPCAKLVVPSSGSTYQRYSDAAVVPPPSSATIACVGKVRAQALDDQLFRGAVGFGDEVVIAFQFETDAALEVIGEQRAGFARDLHGSFQE